MGDLVPSDPLPPPTKRELHGYPYSPLELAERDAAIKALKRDWPNTPGGKLWLGWIYDFVKHTPEEELREMIDSGKFDRPPEKKAA